MANIKGLGNNRCQWTSKPKISKKPETLTIFPEEVKTILDVVSDGEGRLVFLSDAGKLYLPDLFGFEPKIKPLEGLPPMKSVHSGYYHFFAMSNEDQPKIYGWGRNNYNQIGMNSQNSKVHTPTLAEGIENLTIHQVYPARLCSFFLNRETNTLYGSGSNSNGNLGVENPLKLTTVCKLHENVTKVFTGHADHSFIIKTDGKLYGFGYNYHGELGNDRLCAQRTPLEIKLEFPLCKIKKIIISFQFSAILTTDGRLFVSGLARSIGFDTDLTKFTQYPQFKNKKNFITDAASGDGFISFITRDKEVWVGGRYNDVKTLRKISTFNDQFNNIRCAELDSIFLLKSQISYLSQDLGKLLSNGYFSDCKIKNIAVHKILIETRIGKSFDLIRNYLEENCQSKEIEDLLMWVYCDEMRNSKRMKEILNHFGIENPQETKLLKNDLKKLLFDEETSDFKLVVKIEDGNEDNDDDEEELHIHKFILAARCGLFLNMFQNVDQNIKKVKDYSKKSLETIELFISFLYTDEIPITADTDQEFVKEEFEDIVEYYQLNPQIPILEIFVKCSNKAVF
ncbi:hypothetical protein M0813_16377 [Anaeramoeba flamelloides]|uniref:BTB domain-containing protein n=1 Tax=Anaeramoeba flamelloides TaxID=1746091 RepID=A0ABQ8YZQ8_9EUKA|nr:hypothetical protein M0813_16377 [Anaeramoeba flamelloides]